MEGNIFICRTLLRSNKWVKLVWSLASNRLCCPFLLCFSWASRSLWSDPRVCFLSSRITDLALTSKVPTLYYSIQQAASTWAESIHRRIFSSGGRRTLLAQYHYINNTNQTLLIIMPPVSRYFLFRPYTHTLLITNRNVSITRNSKSVRAKAGWLSVTVVMICHQAILRAPREKCQLWITFVSLLHLTNISPTLWIKPSILWARV